MKLIKRIFNISALLNRNAQGFDTFLQLGRLLFKKSFERSTQSPQLKLDALWDAAAQLAKWMALCFLRRRPTKKDAEQWH